jgi:hypothetical protein
LCALVVDTKAPKKRIEDGLSFEIHELPVLTVMP